MLEFEYASYASRVVFGAGATHSQELLRTLETVEARRILLIAAPAEENIAQRIADSLGDRIAGWFTQVQPHVPMSVAKAARDAAQAVQADALMSIGGGSTTGTAKAVALETGLPILAVPTTYAGSEVTPVWGLTENARKRTGTDVKVLPRLVIYDPELTVSLPRALSAVSGLNALAHCVEALWSPRRNPITSLIAEEGMRALASGLPPILADPADIEARSSALYGVWLAGTAFATAGSDLHHKICHVLGGAYDLPHAETHAVVLPYATAVAAPRIDGVDGRIAAALGAAGESAAETIARFDRVLNAPVSLRQIGLREDQIEDAARRLDETLSQLPDPVSRSVTEALLEAAFTGASPLSLLSIR